MKRRVRKATTQSPNNLKSGTKRIIIRKYATTKVMNGKEPIISKDVGSQEDQLCLELVNKFRKENGLSPLQFSKRLSEIVKPHTEDMLNGRKPLGHNSFKEILTGFLCPLYGRECRI